MNRLAFFLIAIIFVVLNSPLRVVAQANQSAQSGQQEPAAKPTPSAQPAQASPAQPSAPNATSASPTPAASEAKPKKTWTNEDVGSLREDSAISTFNTPKPNPGKPSQNHAPLREGGDAKWYRGEIEKLQAQIPPLDEKITKLRDAIDGKQVDEVRHYTWSKPDDWRDQLARLEKQREDIQTKIAGLIDEARHKGIPAGQLP